MLGSRFPPTRTTHCYHTTGSGHDVHLTIVNESKKAPVLISFHGGGIVNGSRRDEHIPQPIIGVIISVDYRLLVPCTGREILEDITALLDYIPSLPIDPHSLFMAGFSGGGYPLRMAALLSAKESVKPSPRYTVLGWVSFFGMGGDLLHDHWLFPRGASGRAIDMSHLEEEQEKYWEMSKRWFETTEEVSDSPYTETLEGHREDRGGIWEYWHLTGSINDSITGEKGLSKRMAGLPYANRIKAIPEKYNPIFPQVHLQEYARSLPPLLLIHGDEDEVVPYEESLNTLKAMQAGGGQVEMITVVGGSHGLEEDGKEAPGTNGAYLRTVKFMLDRYKSTRPE